MQLCVQKISKIVIEESILIMKYAIERLYKNTPLEKNTKTNVVKISDGLLKMA